MAGLVKPLHPQIGKVTHHNAKLNWGETKETSNENDSLSTFNGRYQFELQCLNFNKSDSDWHTIYTGFANEFEVENLTPLSRYQYRVRLITGEDMSPWSDPVDLFTQKEPLTGEQLHKTVLRNDRFELEKILSSGEVKIDVFDKFGMSPLMQACYKGYTDLVELLLEFGADVGLQNENGKSALMLACFGGNDEAVEVLRENGASYEQVDRNGLCALHWAVDGGNPDLVTGMIKDGAKANAVDSSAGWTPLIRCAAVGGNAIVGRALVKNGAEIDYRDEDGKTALMVAVVNGYSDLVQVLVESGADLMLKNSYGKTAYEMALSMEKRGIARFLDEFAKKTGKNIR